MSTWTYMNIEGQGHALTLVKSHSDLTFSNFFSVETARPIEAKFHKESEYKWFIQMMTLCCPWPILQQGQIWSLLFLYGKMLKL